MACAEVERQLNDNQDPIGLASKVFNNADLGYYKVSIERPDRRKAKFTPEAIAPLRFDKALSEVMEYLYQEHGERVYEAGFLKSIDKAILSWCEDNDISLNTKAKSKLLDVKHWLSLQALHRVATELMAAIGQEEYNDYNPFKELVEAQLKAQKTKLSASEKNAILNAVSWYDDSAAKVVKKVVKLSNDKMTELLERYQCTEADLPDFGYYPLKGNEFITYESSADLRDSESIPLTYPAKGEHSAIHQYFVNEVQPHVDEAWLNLDSVKIGYEISFNKYFYRHKPLRSLEDVAADIIQLEQKAEGLIAQILGVSGFDSAQPTGHDTP